MIKKGYSKERTISRVAQTLLLLFICLVSCQNDKDDFEYRDKDGRFMILPVFQQQKMEISTKALISGYHEYKPESGEVIYAWAKRYAPTDSLIQGEFRRSGEKWNSTVEVKSGESYKLFAFQPGGICTDRRICVFSESQGNFALTVRPINIVTLGEPSISIAAARDFVNNGSYANPTPSPGNYDLGTISNNTEKDKVLLAMRHLYSKVNLSFTLDTIYSKLRSVVLTSVKIVADQGQSGMSLTFNQNSNPTWDNSYTGDTLEVNLLQPGDSIVLSASTTTEWNSSTFAGYKYLAVDSFCYLPKSDLPVKLAVEYNVYTGDIIADTLNNKNYNDRLTRKGQSAINGSILPSGTGIPKAGTKYNVKVGVKPSYLYVLSDDDLDIPLLID